MHKKEGVDISSFQPGELIKLAQGIIDARKNSEPGVEFINGRIYILKDRFDSILAKAKVQAASSDGSDDETSGNSKMLTFVSRNYPVFDPKNITVLS